MTRKNLPAFDLTGQLALVTGAARGLGRAIALALAQAGADVALGLHDVNTGAELVREIAALGRRALPLQMDMARLEQCGAPSRKPQHISASSISWSTMPESPRKTSLKTFARKILISPWR